MNANDMLRIIEAHWMLRRSPPTIRDLQMHCGYKSTSAVYPYLKQLEANGLLLPREKYRGRHIIPANIKVSFE